MSHFKKSRHYVHITHKTSDARANGDWNEHCCDFVFIWDKQIDDLFNSNKTESQEALTRSVAEEREHVLYKSLCSFLEKMRNVVRMTGKLRFVVPYREVHKDVHRRQNNLRLFSISNFRRVLNAIFFLLGDSPGDEFYVPTFRNTLFHRHRRCEYEDGTVFRMVGT
jgi:hypothetical protein